MPRKEITIDRSRQIVWDFFTHSKNWEKWWGASLEKVDPGWQSGATLEWGMGPPSKIVEVVPQKHIHTAATWMETSWRFTPLDEQSTLVEMESNPTGGASFSDGGLEYGEQMASKLDKFKKCVESKK